MINSLNVASVMVLDKDEALAYWKKFVEVNPWEYESRACVERLTARGARRARRARRRSRRLPPSCCIT